MRSRILAGSLLPFALLAISAVCTLELPAQEPVVLPVLASEATPIGALPPVALPMPAHRDDSYWGVRLQVGQRRERGPEDLLAIAGGIDYQFRGGSIFGLTGGYQWRQNCQSTNGDCGHSLFGARARFNFITGGPTIAGLLGDDGATSTLGTELGLGYAPSVGGGLNACTIDVGVPLSIAMLERLHLVTFVTPGVVWDLDCSSGDTEPVRSYLLGFGFGLQQLGFRGLDVHVGMQRMFRGATGFQFGVSVSWIRLP
ncbi:MAG TPA: hypothetical protein VNO75_01320 [Gemmatimonadaceae bacterium]|nr:hypothetical protein [Gemmatimonadaceae bacterium]